MTPKRSYTSRASNKTSTTDVIVGLLIAMFIVFNVALIAAIVYVAVHFLLKVW